MNLFNNISIFQRRVFGTPISTELYSDIDLIPLKNWEMFNAGKGHEWLLVDNRVKGIGLKLSPEKVQETYFKLHDQFSEIIGENDQMLEYRTFCLLQIEAITAYCDGDEHQKDWIDYYETLIKQLSKQGAEDDAIKNRILCQQLFGQTIDPEKMTAGEYARLLKVVKSQNKPKANG